MEARYRYIGFGGGYTCEWPDASTYYDLPASERCGKACYEVDYDSIEHDDRTTPRYACEQHAMPVSMPKDDYNT